MAIALCYLSLPKHNTKQVYVTLKSTVQAIYCIVDRTPSALARRRCAPRFRAISSLTGQRIGYDISKPHAATLPAMG
jgi:hypothetical protein